MTYFQGVHINDHDTGFRARVTPLYALQTTELTRLVGAMFGGVGTTIDTNFYTATATAAVATVTLATGAITLNVTDADTEGYASIKSLRAGRFMLMAPNLYRGLVRVPSPSATDAGTFQCRWGAYDTTGAGVDYTNVPTAFFFSLVLGDSPTSHQIGINYQSGSTITTMSGLGTAMNGDVTHVLHDDNYHAYEIVYLSTGAYFFADDVYLGCFEPTTTPFTSLDLRTLAYLGNLGSGSGIAPGPTFYVASNSIARLGKGQTVPTWRYINGAGSDVLKRGSGGIKRIINNDNVGSIILYDGITATATICSIDLTKVLGELDMDITLQDGLYYAATGAVKLTVVYE